MRTGPVTRIVDEVLATARRPLNLMEIVDAYVTARFVQFRVWRSKRRDYAELHVRHALQRLVELRQARRQDDPDAASETCWERS